MVYKVELYDSDDRSDDAEPIKTFESWEGPTPDFGDVLTLDDAVYEIQQREIVADKNGRVTAVLLSVEPHKE
jgi:hypothetical protein